MTDFTPGFKEFLRKMILDKQCRFCHQFISKESGVRMYMEDGYSTRPFVVCEACHIGLSVLNRK